MSRTVCRVTTADIADTPDYAAGRDIHYPDRVVDARPDSDALALWVREPTRITGRRSSESWDCLLRSGSLLTQPAVRDEWWSNVLRV